MSDFFDDENYGDDDGYDMDDDLGASLDTVASDFNQWLRDRGHEDVGEVSVAFGNLQDIDGLRGNVFRSPEDIFNYLRDDQHVLDFSMLVYDDQTGDWYLYVGDSN